VEILKQIVQYKVFISLEAVYIQRHTIENQL